MYSKAYCERCYFNLNDSLNIDNDLNRFEKSKFLVNKAVSVQYEIVHLMDEISKGLGAYFNLVDPNYIGPSMTDIYKQWENHEEPYNPPIKQLNLDFYNVAKHRKEVAELKALYKEIICALIYLSNFTMKKPDVLKYINEVYEANKMPKFCKLYMKI